MVSDTSQMLYGVRKAKPVSGQMNVAGDEVVVARPEDFESFYRREFRKVVGLAYALSGSRLAAEDLAQEAMIAAHGQWNRIGLYDRPDAWVRRVLANKAVSLHRRKTAELRAVTRLAVNHQEALPEMEPEDAEFWRVVRSLAPKQAQAVALFYVEDRSIDDIAGILDCTPSTAKVHLFKARKNLAKKLGLEVDQ